MQRCMRSNYLHFKMRTSRPATDPHGYTTYAQSAFLFAYAVKQELLAVIITCKLHQSASSFNALRSKDPKCTILQRLAIERSKVHHPSTPCDRKIQSAPSFNASGMTFDEVSTCVLGPSCTAFFCSFCSDEST